VRVLIVTPWYPWPEIPYWGVWVKDHARSLLPAHEVAILHFTTREDAGRPYTLSDQVEDGLRTVRISYPQPRIPGPGLLATARGTAKGLRALEADGFVPDVVHAHVFLSSPAALIAKRRTGAPLVLNEHLTRVTESKLSMLERALARFTYRRTDLVCTTAGPMVERVRQLGAQRTMHTRNVVDTEQFHPATGRRSDGEIRAIAAGSMNEKKGHRYLLEAIAEVRRSEPRLTLDLYGDGELRGELEEQARSLGIEDAVHFRGYVTLDGLAERMREADLHLLPSLRENQPLVAAEAMATGIPTVGTDVGGVPEMLEGGAGVVVPRADSKALAGAIAEVCSSLDSFDPAALARLARERYGRDAVGRQWTEIYEALVSGRADQLGEEMG
jgi:glycosyltransferase involved in cell wall biosynthesis